MPAGTRYVGRPTPWGNPFKEVERDFGVERALILFTEAARGCWNPRLVADLSDAYVARIYDAQHRWRERLGGPAPYVATAVLRGLNLACWCALDQPCHADVLLKVANEGAV